MNPILKISLVGIVILICMPIAAWLYAYFDFIWRGTADVVVPVVLVCLSIYAGYRMGNFIRRGFMS